MEDKTRAADIEKRDDDAQGKRKRTQNACTTCRQQKLRCDGSIKFPAPCSRCTDRGLQCRVDPKFKRTPIRNRLEQVSRQLETMREKLELRSAQPAEELHCLESESEPGEHKSGASIFPVVEHSLLPRSIGDTETPPDVFVALFHEFHSNYHPHLPIVDTTATIESIFVESPLLFNTILFIACRHHPTYSSLHKQFISPLHGLLSELSINPNKLDINKSAQALLLLCLWPLPFERQRDDASWLRCGMASHLALQNEFNRPSFAQQLKWRNVSKDELQRRTVTWLGCFLVDFSLSSKLGLPATVVPDFSIRNPPSDLSDKFKHHLQIACTCAKFFPALSNNQFSATGLIDTCSRWTLIQLFDGELDILQTQLSRDTASYPPPAESKILLLTNRLHLHTYVLHEDIQNVVGATETSGMMIKGFRTAIDLIDVISQEQERHVLKYYPTHIVRSLVVAILWLLKLMAISDSRKSAQIPENRTESHDITTITLLDAKSIEAGENHVRGAFTILFEFSVIENDESQRASRFIEAIGGCRRAGRVGSVEWGQSIKMKGQMASSLIYDAVWLSKERERLASAEIPSQEDTNVIAGHDQLKDTQDKVVLPTGSTPGGLVNTWNHAVELDETSIGPDFWGMLGDHDGFCSWDFPWDNGFGFAASLDD